MAHWRLAIDYSPPLSTSNTWKSPSAKTDTPRFENSRSNLCFRAILSRRRGFLSHCPSLRRVIKRMLPLQVAKKVTAVILGLSHRFALLLHFTSEMTFALHRRVLDGRRPCRQLSGTRFGERANLLQVSGHRLELWSILDDRHHRANFACRATRDGEERHQFACRHAFEAFEAFRNLV